MPTGNRPTIKPWLPTVWRDHETFQIGVDPSAGVLVSGLDAVTARWLTALDGSRSEAEVLAEASAVGLDISTAVRILSGLGRAGALISAPLGVGTLGDTGALLPELVNLTAALPAPQDGTRALAARGQRHVVIDGANRIGVPLGALLVASGVGRLSFVDTEPARRCDASVGGLDLDDEGVPRFIAAQQAIRRISPRSQGMSEPVGEGPGAEGPREPDLIILCQPWTAHDPLQIHGLTDRRPHLAVAVREGAVVIGPLVLPGRTSCLHCAELHRTDRDSRWPAVAAQLVAGSARAMYEPTSVLASLAAALAAGQVLDHLDAIRSPVVLEATLELRPPEWQLHRRRWPPHADCGCLVPAAGAARAG